MNKRIVSGMRSTGKLHLGHYLGVIQNWVELQKKYESFFFVADWHALTTKYDKTENLKNDVVDVVIDWLSCGIDPEISTIYVQSLVPEIAELNIYLSMVTPQNWVERDPTLKDMAKILRTKEGANSQISYGLMGYPVLMSGGRIRPSECLDQNQVPYHLATPHYELRLLFYMINLFCQYLLFNFFEKVVYIYP